MLWMSHGGLSLDYFDTERRLKCDVSQASSEAAFFYDFKEIMITSGGVSHTLI